MFVIESSLIVDTQIALLPFVNYRFKCKEQRTHWIGKIQELHKENAEPQGVANTLQRYKAYVTINCQYTASIRPAILLALCASQNTDNLKR